VLVVTITQPGAHDRSGVPQHGSYPPQTDRAEKGISHLSLQSGGGGMGTRREAPLVHRADFVRGARTGTVEFMRTVLRQVVGDPGPSSPVEIET